MVFLFHGDRGQAWVLEGRGQGAGELTEPMTEIGKNGLSPHSQETFDLQLPPRT